MNYSFEKPRYNCYDWEVLLNKLNSIHPNKYIYPNIPLKAYVKISQKIEIICKKHGKFEQTIGSQLKGRGCDKCARERQALSKFCSKDHFLKRAQKTHGDKYDYTETEYLGNHTKTKIFCKRCRDYFYQSPANHYRVGCWRCGRANRIDSRKITLDQFIERGKKLNGNKFNYDGAYFEGTRVIIKCNVCGHLTRQFPGVHLSGRGCRKCQDIKMRRDGSPCWNPNKTQEERERGRDTFENYEFIQRVLKRDNYICQITTQRGGSLGVHHLDGYHWCKEKRFDINNGITISKEMHDLFHTIYGNRNNTKQQFSEFLQSLDILLCT